MPIIHEDAFRAWEACVVPGLREDPMWRFNAYRVSLYILDLAKDDLSSVERSPRGAAASDQLYRALTSIAANVSEGLGRASAAERHRFFGLALGSVRESITWYHSMGFAFAKELIEARIDQLGELRRILIGAQKWLSTKPHGTQLM